ncbi:MAG: TetR/AcrR family transcriptional regulator [Chloroflexi bacterium]|nr:TetR/AcrR family transcriptional regulator [Chloroflexota bacterium]
MARKPADQTVSRKDIIRAAARVFRERGFHGTSMQLIADAVGLQKGSLYHHIASKEELLHDVMMTGVTQLGDRLRAVADSLLSPAQKLRKLVESHICYAAENIDIATVVLFEHQAMLGFPMLREEYVARRDFFESQFRTVIQEGVESGVFRPVDVPIVAQALLGAHNWLVMWYRPEGRLSSQEIADVIADTFLRGLLAQV